MSAHSARASTSSAASSTSDDDDDVVVMRVCARRRCQCIADLQFDEETNEYYCGPCRALFERTKTEGFRVLLDQDELALVQLIFRHFERDACGYWTYKEWNSFASHTDHPTDHPIDSAQDLHDYFKEEFDIELRAAEDAGFVVHCVDLEDMYGGFAYNNIDALVEDSEALEDEGILDTGVLE